MLMLLLSFAAVGAFPEAPAEAERAGWHVPGGDEGRSGQASVGKGPMDVLGVYRLFDSPQLATYESPWRIAAVADPHGRAYIGISTGEVSNPADGGLLADAAAGVLRIDDLRRGSTTWIANVTGITEQVVLAYDRSQDLLVVRQRGPSHSPVIQFRDPEDFSFVWGVAPSDLGAPDTAPAAAVVDGLAALGAASIWDCSITLGDGQRIAHVTCGASAEADVRIGAIDRITREVLWAAPLQLPLFGSARPAVAGYPGPITVVDEHLVLEVELEAERERAVVWLDPEGNPLGARTASEAAGQAWLPAADANNFVEVHPDRSRWASRVGALAVYAVWDRVLFIDPTSSAAPRTADGPSYEQDGVRTFAWGAPVASGEHVLVPFRNEIHWYTMNGAATGVTWGAQGWLIGDALAADDKTVYVALVRDRASAEDRTTAVARLETATGREIQFLATPVVGSFTDYITLLPLGDQGLLLLTREGEAVLLGLAEDDAKPVIHAVDPFPRPNGEMTIEFLAPLSSQEPERYMVHWGDGAFESVLAPGVLSHEFRDTGIHTIRITAVYADARTATAESTVDVGGAAPQHLNFLQRAFAPDRLDTTWGIIGLAVVLSGAIAALLQRRRHHSILDKELARLAEIRAAGLLEPARATRAVDENERRITTEFSRRRLNDAQYSVLMLQTTDLRRALRRRAVAQIVGVVSPAFRAALDAALEDGRITGTEARMLQRALSRERGLAPSDRKAVARFIEEWREQAD
jgi:hypothetical protein